MVAPIRPASFLPAVKCSSCKADIEISLMSDHICWKRGAASSRVRASSSDRNDTNEQALSQGTEPKLDDGGHSTPRRLGPPGNINAPAANPPLAPQGYTLATSVGTKAAGTLPDPCSNVRVSSHPKLLRSTTAPVPRLHERYPPDLPSNLECAFPPFPTHRVQRTRSPSPMNPKPYLPSDSASETPGQDPSCSPLSIITTGSANVLRRMNTIVPGPFDTRKRNEGRSDGAVQRTDFRGHSRTSTTSSDASMERPFSSDGDAHSRRPSIARSYKSSVSLRYRDSRDAVLVDLDGARLPSGLPPPGPARPETLERFLHQLGEDDSVPRPGQLRVEQRSNNFPAAAAVRASHGYLRPVGLRTPSGSAVRAGPQTSASDNQPAPHLGGCRGEQPPFTSPEQSESPPVNNNDMAPLRNAGPKGRSNRPKFEDASLIPQRSQLDDPGRHGSHPSSASASSLESAYSSSVKVRSPRSSLATSQASSIIDTRPSETAAVENKDDASYAPQAAFSTQQGIDQNRHMFQSPSTEVTKPSGLSFSRPRPPETLADPCREVPVEAPESPMDPDLHRGSRSRIDDENVQTELASAPGTSQTAALADQIITTRETLNGKPTNTFNGTCRGCGEAIRGKSVKAADGRLTGRYHKHCFVCKTCSEPFQTVDFYVLANHPYCERHYHTLNGSLCQSCDEGIEGQYLETQSKRKFHPRCFTCSDCQQILLHDYYELSTDMFHCERHAFRAAQQSTWLGPNPRNPERRTTRLMVMAA